MNQSIKSALIDQANYELLAAHSYFAMSYWCEANDYPGFGEFFAKQAEEELEHFGAFCKHLLDRGIQPAISETPAPTNEFNKILEVAILAQQLEGRNTAQIKLCYELSLEVKDYESQPMLLKFIEEQIEEDAWAAKMVSLVKQAECPGALYNLNRHILKELS